MNVKQGFWREMPTALKTLFKIGILLEAIDLIGQLGNPHPRNTGFDCILALLIVGPLLAWAIIRSAKQ